jgi:hypothetical protein
VSWDDETTSNSTRGCGPQRIIASGMQAVLRCSCAGTAPLPNFGPALGMAAQAVADLARQVADDDTALGAGRSVRHDRAANEFMALLPNFDWSVRRKAPASRNGVSRAAVSMAQYSR